MLADPSNGEQKAGLPTVRVSPFTVLWPKQASACLSRLVRLHQPTHTNRPSEPNMIPATELVVSMLPLEPLEAAVGKLCASTKKRQN